MFLFVFNKDVKFLWIFQMTITFFSTENAENEVFFGYSILKFFETVYSKKQLKLGRWMFLSVIITFSPHYLD